MIDDLIKNPSSFDFFAAVRLLERLADEWQDDHGNGSSTRTEVGGDADPKHETIRFRAEPAMTFSVGDIARVDVESNPDNDRPPRTEMSVNFFGLIGPNGALPQHYTTLILERLRQRDHALRQFLDLFQHRSISLLYRAWEKYRVPFLYERSERAKGETDLATLALYSLVGLGTDGLRQRRTFDDRVSLFYSGTFSRQQRPALELQRILSEQMAVPVKVHQFFGRWMTLGDGELSRLSSQSGNGNRYNRLGVSVVLGRRIRDIQGSFRLVLGPVNYTQFRRFTPPGDDLKPLCELTRSFTGPEFEFDVQVVLAPRQVPECRLDSTATDGPRLGWNTWLRSQEIDRDVDDAVFLLPDI